GAVRTAELTLPGFRHDVAATNLNQLVHSPFFQQHRLGVEVVTATRPVGTVFPDGRFLGLTTDRDTNRRAIAQFSRADADAWARWGDDFDRESPSLFARLTAAHPSQDATPLLTESLRRHLSARFESEAVRALIAAWGLHMDYAPDVPGGC